MTTAAVLFLKQGQRRFTGNLSDQAPPASQVHSDPELLHVKLPVGTQLNVPAERQQQREAAVTMDTALQVLALGPGIW